MKIFRVVKSIFKKDSGDEMEKIRKQFWDLKDICTKSNWKWSVPWGKKNIVNHGEEPIPPKLFDIMRSILLNVPNEYFKVLEMDILPNTNGTLGLVLSDKNKSHPKNSLDIIVTKGCEIFYVIRIIKKNGKDVKSGTILMTVDYIKQIRELVEKEFGDILK